MCVGSASAAGLRPRRVGRGTGTARRQTGGSSMAEQLPPGFPADWRRAARQRTGPVRSRSMGTGACGHRLALMKSGFICRREPGADRPCPHGDAPGADGGYTARETTLHSCNLIRRLYGCQPAPPNFCRINSG